MKFTFKIWVLSISILLLDIDPSDGNVVIGIEVAWK